MMMLCEIFWKFSQSGLPQMLLLLLFTCGLYFTFRAIEDQEEGKSSLVQPLIAAGFFGLMVLTHWLTAWIFFGYLIFAAIAFRPRGIVALASFAVVMLMVAYPVIRMIQITGQPFGLARFVFYNGLAGGSESTVMRTLDLSATPLQIDGLLVKIFTTTLVQAANIIPFLGGILAAPIFFIALLHPFKRKPIADFRWLLLLMWLFAALGMAIFGINTTDTLHPNQIHLLFAPVMAAYGLAFLSILWSRLDVVSSTPFLRNAHYWVIILLSAAPMLMSLPRDVILYLRISDLGGWHQMPPYFPKGLKQVLPPQVNRDPIQPDIIVSDQPWAVAWYSDVPSLWLPRSMDDLSTFEKKASDLGTPVAGILVTPSSGNTGTSLEVVQEYGDLAPLAFESLVRRVSGPVSEQNSFLQNSPYLEPIRKRYPYRLPLHNLGITYYSSKRPTDPENSN